MFGSSDKDELISAQKRLIAEMFELIDELKRSHDRAMKEMNVLVDAYKEWALSEQAKSSNRSQ